MKRGWFRRLGSRGSPEEAARASNRNTQMDFMALGFAKVSLSSLSNNNKDTIIVHDRGVWCKMAWSAHSPQLPFARWAPART
jgi:hypothetical protein